MRPLPPDVVEVAIASHPRHLPFGRAHAACGAATAGFPGEDGRRILRAVTEGVANLVRHGDAGSTTGRIDRVLDASPGALRLEIRDRVRFVDPALLRSRPLDEVGPGGRTVRRMRSTADRVAHRPNEDGGRTLTLTKGGRRPGAGTPPEEPA